MGRQGKTERNIHELSSKNTQWHMAFPSAMKLEFMAYNKELQYQTEYLLNPKALQMDLLIIKKDDRIEIENEIGRIFKRHNIIEYKSPYDSEGINEYFKVISYAGLYKAGKDGKAFEPEDISVTMIREGKPVKLFQWLRAHDCRINQAYNGVYYIENAGFFGTQVIVAKELDESEHIWIKSLTDKLSQRQVKELIIESNVLLGRPEAEYVEALLQIVSKANYEIFDKIKKEDADMYSAWRELFQPEIDEAVSQAVSQVEIKKTVEAVENAIRKLHMSKDEACAFMDIDIEEYESYKRLVQNPKVMACAK